MDHVIVVIGSGQIGQAIARRVGMDTQSFWQTFAKRMQTQRHSVQTLAEKASRLGAVMGVIHAAGVFPSQASPETILKVDLYGTALVLELFGKIMARHGVGLVIASQSGHRLGALTPEKDRILATTPTEALLQLPILQNNQIKDSLHAYQLSKRTNVLRVKAKAVQWGRGGARLNAISPGLVMPPSCPR